MIKKQTTWDNLNGKERQLKQVEKMLEYASQRPKKAFKNGDMEIKLAKKMFEVSKNKFKSAGQSDLENM